MTEEQYWRLTPAKLMAIVAAKREQIKRDDYRTGVLTMVVRAAVGAKNVHPFDFFPQHKDTSAGPARGITSPDEVRRNFRAYIEAVKQHGKETKESA